MFCPKCGNEVPENAVNCPSCGASIGAKNEGTANQGEVFTSDEKKGNSSLAKIVAAVVAVLVVIFIISKAFGGSYKDPVKKLVKLCNQKKESSLDYDSINQPDFLADYNKIYEQTLAKSDYDDDYKDSFEYVFDKWEDTYGEDFKLKLVKISDVEKIDKDDLKDYQKQMREFVEDKDDREDLIDEMKDTLEYYEDEYDLSKGDSKKIINAYKKMLKRMSKVKITKGYEMNIKIKITGEDGKATFNEKHVEVLKVNGKWIFSNSYTPSTLNYSFE